MEKQVDIAVVGCGPIAKAVGQGQQAALSAVSYLEQSGVFSREKLVKV